MIKNIYSIIKAAIIVIKIISIWNCWQALLSTMKHLFIDHDEDYPLICHLPLASLE